MTYDIIFAGGGASACITAGRLAAADPTLKILVLEAGPHSKDLPRHTHPGLFGRNLGNPEVFFLHQGRQSAALHGRSPLVPSGKTVGGGSSVNFMMHTRAAASDYDDWEKVHGNPGWGSADLFDLLKKSETYQAPFSDGVHGTSGPLKVSYGRPEFYYVADEFLRVAKEYDPIRGTTTDLDVPGTVDKYGPWARFIDVETGTRSDTAHHYVYTQEQNENLTVLTSKRVFRVIFERDRAVGVEYFDDEDSSKTQPIVARASRLVVLGAGAFGSPTILERSGIGASERLAKLGIPQIVDLPGVGENYMDHNLLFSPFFASDDTKTVDAPFRASEKELQEFAQEFSQTGGKSFLANNGLHAGIRIRPNEAELKSMSPDFDKRWKTFFEPAPDKPVMLIVTYEGIPSPDPALGATQKFHSFAYYTAYPVATGFVHITSATDAYAPVDFHPGYLDEPADVVILRWAYKKVREYARRLKCYRGEIPTAHPPFAPTSAAALQVNADPVLSSAPDLEYTAEDDALIDEFHRRTVETTWHSIGTCGMKPREKGGVVDSRLNVYGVKGLKIADLSITPANVGANTYSTAIAVGEKAALLIAEDLGISGV